MNPPAPVSAEIVVDTARMPVGRIAAMKPEPSRLPVWLRGSAPPAMNGTRTIMPARSSMACGRLFLRMKLPVDALAGHVCHWTSPGDIAWPIGMSDRATSTSTVSTLATSGLTSGDFSGPAGQQRGNGTGSDGDGQYDDTRGFSYAHSLT